MKKLLLRAGVAGVLFATTAAFAAEDSATNASAQRLPMPCRTDQTPAKPEDPTPQPAAASDQTAAPATVAPETPVAAPVAAPVPTVVAKAPPRAVPAGSQGLIMNFRNVPVDQVLNYMSKVARKYIIHAPPPISAVR